MAQLKLDHLRRSIHRGLCVLAALAVALPVVALAQGASSRIFLWQVSSPTATVYLLGSVHIASPSMYPLDARIETAFSRAGTVVLEIPIDPASQLEAAQKMGQAGVYPPGDSLDRHLSRETLDALNAYLAQAGISIDQMRPFRPWFVSMLVSLSAMQQLGYSPRLGIEQHFVGRIQPAQRLGALERVDEQVALFSGISETIQEQMLKEALGNIPEMQEHMERAVQIWQTGDLAAADDLWLKPLRTDFPDLYRELFVQRNQRMAATIERYLRSSGTHLVIVGSGHLVGPDGIVTLLSAKGFSPAQQ
ncbi:MAG TPA: TraB/GumN family protein [Candidatus Baltobacteraceae bacterium]|nr:TraB/GumN family protein [Candidatus Baltobacteraceae bacterium]